MIRVAIENNIKVVLDQKGWSIRRLSKELNRDYGQVHRLVTSNPLPDGTTLGVMTRIAGRLGVRLDDLITYENGVKD